MLDAPRYQRAKAIFFEACEQPADARDAFIDRECAGDGVLRHAVRELLAHDAEPLSLIEDGLAAADTPLRQQLERLADSTHGTAGGDDQQRMPALPERIGRYRIVSRLGAGGMGVVYRAEQDNPRRQVALKVIAPGPGGQTSRQVLRRFEHEAQILGRLHHPGIAQVYEAGMHDAGEGGQPYFAMELVRGEPLLKHCEHAGADARERLRLFIAICEAVQHAHQQGVIHRDLKPANILVEELATTAADGLDPGRTVLAGAQAKILDFGVARLTDSDVQATTMHTQADQLIGTVAYMSPEQMSGRSDDIDTRSDVYALGVILFELLAGRLPYDVAGKTIPDVIRTVSDGEPAALSAIDRSFRGDLETIAGKAIERDKAIRYQSAGELAADVRRFLNDQPIQARPPSTVYQLRKFARRNKVLVGGAVAVVLALIAGIITTSWQAQQARRAAMTARNEADKASSISEFLERMLSSARPTISQGRDLTVRQVLDEAAAELDRTGDDLAPEVEGALRLTVARAYLSLDLHEPAQPHLDLALERLRAAYGEDHVTIADCLEAMGRARRAHGDWDGAIQITREALAMMRRVAPGDHDVTAMVLASLAWLLPRMSDTTEAEQLLTESMEMMSRLRGPDAVETAILKIDLASISHGNPAQTEQLVIEAIEDITREVGERHLAIPRALNLLGAYQQIGGRLEEAEASYQRALDIRLAVNGPDSSDAIDNVQLIAWVAMARNEPQRALALLKEYLAHARIALRDDGLLLAAYLSRLGGCEQVCGDNETAATYFREAITLCDRSGEKFAPALGPALAALAALRAEARDDEEAMALAERCLALPYDALPDRHWARGDALMAKGLVLTRRGQFAEAEPLLVTSETIARSGGERHRPRRERAVKALVDLYEQWNSREPTSDQAEQLQRWRKALPME